MAQQPDIYFSATQHEYATGVQAGFESLDIAIPKQIYDKCVRNSAGLIPMEYFQTSKNDSCQYTTYQTPLEPPICNIADSTSLTHANTTSLQPSSNTSSMYFTPSINTLESDLYIQRTWSRPHEPHYQNFPAQIGCDASSWENDLRGIGSQFDSQSYPEYGHLLCSEGDIETRE
jgi:hypothetical protein